MIHSRSFVQLSNILNKRLFKQWFQLLISASLTTALVSCGSDDAAAPPLSVANPTYHKDVAPLLYENCVKCHKKGGIGGFSLLQNEGGIQNAVNKAELMNADIQEQIMPPWLADNSGQCNTFEHARWLEDSERITFANWVNTGKPLGDAPPSPPIETALKSLDKVDTTVSISGDYKPVGDATHPNDDYRCFVLDTDQYWAGKTTDMLLTEFEVKPGNDELVHHVILYLLDTVEMEQAAITQYGTDPQQSYTCFGDANIPNFDPTFLAGWAPGTGVTQYPTGTGIRLKMDRKLVMQVHYNLATKNPASDTDRTTIDLKLTTLNGATEAFVYAVIDSQFDIPPDTIGPDATVVHPELVPQLHPLITSYNVWGLFPHMHTYGRSISVTTSKTLGGAETCMVDVPRWNFEWQQFFFYDKKSGPINIKPNEYLNLTCQYDTTGALNNVKWGEGTAEEMCLSFLYVTPNF